MGRSKSGFTIIEMITALLIGSILAGIAISGITSAQGGIAAKGARTTYAAMLARARAQAIETGDGVLLHVDTNGDSVWIEHSGTTLETIRFGEEQNVDLRATPSGRPSVFQMCLTPRGYADSDCATTNLAIRLEFWQNADSTSVIILPLGQLVGM